MEMIEEHNEQYKRLARMIEIENSEEFERAYDIHGKFYNGEAVSDEEQKFFNEYCVQLSEINRELGSFGISLYLIYWGKYVTNDD